MFKKFMEDCLLWEGPYSGAGMEGKEKGVAETSCDEFRVSPGSVLLKSSRERKTKMKFSPGRRERWGNGVYKIWIYFSLTHSV